MKHLPVRLLVWFTAFVLWPLPPSLWVRDFQVEVLEYINLAGALHEERALVCDLTERVLVCLEKAEAKEIDPWYRDDIRIAWITTRWAQYGVPEFSWHRDSPPHVAATYQVLQCHPDEVWARITARRQAMLGAKYADFFPDGASSPKKPCVSVGLKRNQSAA